MATLLTRLLARVSTLASTSVLAPVSFLATGSAVAAFWLAALVWLRDQPADPYWSRMPAYWLSSHAWAFWASLVGLLLAALWLAPRRGPGGPELVPAAAFLTGLGYAGWQLVRQSLRGTPLIGQVAAFWPDAVILGLALAAGAWAGGALLHRSSAALRLPGAGAGKPRRPGEPREPRSVARGRIPGGRSGDLGHGPRP